jgi:hypothetical protein
MEEEEYRIVRRTMSTFLDELNEIQLRDRSAAQRRGIQVPRVQCGRSRGNRRGRGACTTLSRDGAGSSAPPGDRSESIRFQSKTVLLPYFLQTSITSRQPYLPYFMLALVPLLSSPFLSLQFPQLSSSFTSCGMIDRRQLLTTSWDPSTAATGRCVLRALTPCSRRLCCTTGRPMGTTRSTMWALPCC